MQTSSVDPLLDCLVELTRLYSRSMSHSALSAGLPIDPAIGLTPSLFHRAAARAGFASRVVKLPMADINIDLLPAILILQESKACVLISVDRKKNTAKLMLPESGQGEVIYPLEKLEKLYTGRIIFSRPRFRIDHKTAQASDIARKGRHWFWSAFFEQKLLYKDVLIGAVLINAFAIATPFFTMNVYDRVIPGRAMETLWMLAIGVIIVVVFDFVIKKIRSYFIDLAGSRIDVKLSGIIMERVLGMKMADRPSSVGSFAHTLRSFESIRDFASSATVASLIDLPFALIFLFILSWIAWPLVIVPAIIFLLIVLKSLSVRKQIEGSTEEITRATALRNSILIETLSSIETLKSFSGEGYIQKKWETIASQLAKLNSSTRLKTSTMNSMVATGAQVCTVLNVVLGVYLINEKMLTMGGLIASSMLISRFIAPLGQLVALMMQYENAKLSLKMIEEQMEKPQERSSDINYVQRQHFNGDIEFRKVSFSYPEAETPAINEISFKVIEGEHVAIIGKTGSGKTTLTRLIMAMYEPSAGSVHLDGIDLRQIDPAELRTHIGAVEQHTYLYFGSLRENITMAAPYAEDQQIIEAADTAMLSEFVNQHPRGFDLLVGERGELLSGGQRQCVGIARAVLLSPPIIMLDEPTSAMDLSTEKQFIEKMGKFAKGKTMIVVTHRMSLLSMATRVIVIDKGKIVADGPKDKVLQALAGQGRGKEQAPAKQRTNPSTAAPSSNAPAAKDKPRVNRKKGA